jgi:CBS domain containing-hemolysin-like protein
VDILFDPSMWMGLGTLVVLEVVLGIDNLIFIAILADKLPPEQRARARILGLSLALIMRVLFLFCISWLAGLTDPLFLALSHPVSARDLIMILGGAFLLFKATAELHEKLEGAGAHRAGGGARRYAGFTPVVAQIVVLDAVFSLDAVITAVGMTEHLPVMIAAVTIAIGIMMWAARPLMDFVSGRPTVVVLCLGFLLMIGFSLVVEGLGYHIPKGYLYAAISFSILVEAFNQLAQSNQRRSLARLDPRARVAEAVLTLMGTGGAEAPSHAQAEIAGAMGHGQGTQEAFAPQERQMMGRVLHLAQQHVRAIMTPRQDLYWVDLDDDPATLEADIRTCPYACVVVTRAGALDEPLGVVFKKDLLDVLLAGRGLEGLGEVLREPPVVPEGATVLHVMDLFRESRVHVAFVVDEYGALEGLITLTDVLEAIAGDLPEGHAGDDEFTHERGEDGSVLVAGSLTLWELAEALGGPVEAPPGDYETAGGMAMAALQRIPEVGDAFALPGWAARVEAMDGRRVARLRFASTGEEGGADHGRD